MSGHFCLICRSDKGCEHTTAIDAMLHDDPDCPACHGEGLVCEDHPSRPWDSGWPDDCTCGAAGMPCPIGKAQRDKVLP